MADTDEKEKEYFTRLLTFLLGPATQTLHVYFELKILNSLQFFMFLDNHKHILFHELHPDVPCCKCQYQRTTSSQKRGHLYPDQFNLLFESIDGQEIQEHQKKQGERITQYCLCNVSAKRSVKEEDMDITLLYSVIKTCCPPGTVSGNPKWIKEIKKERNFVAHCSSGKVSRSDFERSFENTEKCVLNIAEVVSRQVFKIIKDQISFFKTSDISTVRDLIKSSNDTLTQTLENVMKEQTKNLTENKDTLKKIMDQFEKQKEFLVDINNIMFEVKTLKNVMTSAATSTSTIQAPQTDDVCYVEWKLETPEKWNVDQIKNKLEAISSFVGQWFRIIFVYKGSLVIQTSAPVRIVKDDKKFKQAVKLFLNDVVDKCDLKTKINTRIKIELVVSNEMRKTIQCDNCNRNNISKKAIHYCNDCRENICQKCISDHNLDKLTSGHNFTDPRSNSEFFQTTCSIHRGCDFDFFCVDHNCLCCRYCMVEEHASCQKSSPLEDAAKDVLQLPMFHDFSADLSSIKVTLDKVITSLDENIRHMDDDVGIILKQIKNRKAEIIKRLDKIEKVMTEDIHSLKKEDKAQSEENRRRLYQITGQMENISLKMEQMSRQSSKKHLFVLLKTCKLKPTVNVSTLQNITTLVEKKRMLFRPLKDFPILDRFLGLIELQSTTDFLDYNQSNVNQVHTPILLPQMPKTLKLDLETEIKHADDKTISSIYRVPDRQKKTLFKSHHLLLINMHQTRVTST